MNYLITGVKNFGIELNKDQIKQFEMYYRTLVDWNKRFNLTRITDYREVQIKHFLDSLTVVNVWLPREDSVIDIGSGPGMPGLPLKIVFPEIKLALLESTRKKAEFLESTVDLLELDNTKVIHGRAEEIAHLSQYREKFDVVLSRGVGKLPGLVEFTLPFCRIGGISIFLKKGYISEEISEAQKAVGELGGKLTDNRSIEISELPDERYLVVIRKIAGSPAKYPRNSGIPLKRPIK